MACQQPHAYCFSQGPLVASFLLLDLISCFFFFFVAPKHTKSTAKTIGDELEMTAQMAKDQTMEHQWMFVGNQTCPMPQSCPMIPECRNKMTTVAKEYASTKEFKKGLYYKQRRFQRPGLKSRNKCIPKSSQPKQKIRHLRKSFPGVIV